MGISPCAGGGLRATLVKLFSLLSAGFELDPRITGIKIKGKKTLMKVEPHILLLCSSAEESSRRIFRQASAESQWYLSTETPQALLKFLGMKSAGKTCWSVEQEGQV